MIFYFYKSILSEGYNGDIPYILNYPHSMTYYRLAIISKKSSYDELPSSLQGSQPSVVREYLLKNGYREVDEVMGQRLRNMFHTDLAKYNALQNMI